MTGISHTLALNEILGVETPSELEFAFADFKKGDASGGQRLYDSIGNEMYGLALWTTGSKEDACDAVQTVFLKLLERRSALKRVRNPRAYLLQMTRSASIDLLRKRQPTVDVEIADVPILVSDPDRDIDARRLSRLVSRLPPSQRATVYLRYYSELSFRQIGGVTGVSTFTAASRYRLAMRRLRKWVEKAGS
jgi:RNA polymerase sigma-70 factor (ECF subfamily)